MRVSSRLISSNIAAYLSSHAPIVVSADEKGNSLSTPPLTVGTSLQCIAANVGESPVFLDIELHDVNGVEIAFSKLFRLFRHF